MAAMLGSASPTNVTLQRAGDAEIELAERALDMDGITRGKPCLAFLMREDQNPLEGEALRIPGIPRFKSVADRLVAAVRFHFLMDLRRIDCRPATPDLG